MQDYNNWNRDEDIPRWNPSPDDYNTQPPKDPAPKRRWLIPLIIVAAVMIISIIVGVWVGITRMRKDAMAEKSRIEQQAVESF